MIPPFVPILAPAHLLLGLSFNTFNIHFMTALLSVFSCWSKRFRRISRILHRVAKVSTVNPLISFKDLLAYYHV